MYCTAAEVYETGQISSSIVAEAAVENFIKASEIEVIRLTFTTYHKLLFSSTATDSTDTTLEDGVQDWDVDKYAGNYLWIHSGTGSGQVRLIESNTSDTITVSSSFTTSPDVTSQYRILYSAVNPIVGEEKLDGSGTDTFFVPNIPIHDIESLEINTGTAFTEIDLDDLYKYKRIGKLILSKTADVAKFYNVYPQSVDLKYSFGVYPLPEEVRRFVILASAERMLSAQMGGTYNVPSTYSLPEGAVTIGQAYINIDSTAKRLYAEKQDLIKILPKYSVMS